LNDVRLSFFVYPYKLLFPLIDFNGVKLADERDIACMKIEAISSRGSKKDFIDLYFLIEIGKNSASSSAWWMNCQKDT